MILQPCDLRSIFFAPFVIGALLLVFKSFLFQELILGNLLTYSCITVITLGLLWFYWFEDFVLYFLYWLTATSHHHRQRWVWTFKDVITGLYDQFIHESSIQNTTQKFYSVKYTTDGGVYGFYHELEHYASRMIHAPNSYTFNTQLIMGLPASMIWLVVDKGVTSETSSLNEICIWQSVSKRVIKLCDDMMIVVESEWLPQVTPYERLRWATQVQHQVGQYRALGAHQLLPAARNHEHRNNEHPTVVVSCLIVNEWVNCWWVTLATRPTIDLGLVDLTLAISRKILPVIHVDN